MKGLGVKQFLQMTFTRMPLSEEFAPIMGDLPYNFVGIVYGEPGHGKTEFCIRLAKELARHDKVAWLSYEQGHSASLQNSIIRNKIDEIAGSIVFQDPLKKMEVEGNIYESLVCYLKKRSTPRFIFIDSVDYTRMSVDDFYDLSKKFKEKKGIIFIAHAEGGKIKEKVGRKIEHDGEFGIFVKNYIARPKKSRYSAVDAYIVWEEQARKREPLFFRKQLEKEQPTKKRRGRKPRNK